MQPFSQTTYDTNNKLLVSYFSHDLIKNPVDKLTILDHSSTKLVWYSNPHTLNKNKEALHVGSVFA